MLLLERERVSRVEKEGVVLQPPLESRRRHTTEVVLG